MSSGESGVQPISAIIVGPEEYTIPLLKELSKSPVTYLRPLLEDIVLDINCSLIEKITKTERLPMVQCTSCSKEIQLSVFENHKQQYAPSQRLSKISEYFQVVIEKFLVYSSAGNISR